MEPPVTNPKRVSIEKDKALLNNPEDMFKLLSWQSEQITKLQEQVDQLVAWRSKAEVSIHSMQNSSMSTNRYVADEILIFFFPIRFSLTQNYDRFDQENQYFFVK